MFADKKLVI